MQDLKHVRSIGAFDSGVIRPAFSPADMEARIWLCNRMSEAGLEASIDGMGNVLGRSRLPGKKILIGSHTDTQPQGGWLDGVLGVIYGLEVARACAETPETSRFGIDVASWSDEEGTYMGILGSSSFSGSLNYDDFNRAVDHLTGVSLKEAIKAAGLEGIPPLKLDSSKYIAYLEAHIEQGPHLEAQELLLGVVTAIVGLRTFKLTFTGEQNHAGTTPMEYRKDAGNTLIKLAHALDLEFSSMAHSRTVWTIGHIRLEPGSHSVVPGKAEMLLQFRDTDETLLDAMQRKASGLVQQFCEQGPVEVQLEPVYPHQESVLMDDMVQASLAAAAELHAPGRWTSMPSGASHDAQALANHLPTGMLFIPSIKGISHSILEDSKEEDIIRGCRTLAAAIEAIFKNTDPEG